MRRRRMAGRQDSGRSRRSPHSATAGGAWPGQPDRRRPRREETAGGPLSSVSVLRAVLLPLAVALACAGATGPTAGRADVRIHNIQGAAQRSPLLGRAVRDVPGVVTAVVRVGFWMQDPRPDDDLATSEALFVHLDPPAVDGVRLAAGDDVLASGTIEEYVPASRAGQLPVTQIGGAVLSRILRHDAPAPSAMRLGRGGRQPPTELLCDDARDGDAGSGPFDPAQDGLDFWESLEGMLVEVADPVACSPTSSLGELWVLADGGADATGRNARGGVTLAPGDVNPERIQLVSTFATLPRVDVGTRLLQDGAPRLRGLLDYAFGNFRLAVLAPVEAAGGGGVVPDVARPAAADELSVATFNVENLSLASDAAKFAGLGRIIAVNMGAPDLLALAEVQDDSGSAKDGVVTSVGTAWRLIEAVRAAGGPDYRYIDIEPEDGQDGGQPGGNIRCGLLWREDRGLLLVFRPGGDARRAVRVDRRDDGGWLSPSPARVAPDAACWKVSRKPLAAEFTWRGERLVVIANHWTSKSGDDSLAGAHQPPRQPSAAHRIEQARGVRAFVDELHTAGASVLVLGDLNDFGFSEMLGVLTAGGALVELTDRLPAAERYSYIWQGNSQQLDHVLASPALDTACTDIAVLHVASEFAGQVSDHDPVLARFRVVAR